MYAIIQTGGKQYRVEKDAYIQVELLNHNEGSSVVFEEVLFVSKGEEGKTSVNPPFVVKGELIGQTKGPKVVSCKYKKRQTQRKKFGHRQKYSTIKITEIAKRG